MSKSKVQSGRSSSHSLSGELLFEAKTVDTQEWVRGFRCKAVAVADGEKQQLVDAIQVVDGDSVVCYEVDKSTYKVASTTDDQDSIADELKDRLINFLTENIGTDCDTGHSCSRIKICDEGDIPGVAYAIAKVISDYGYRPSMSHIVKDGAVEVHSCSYDQFTAFIQSVGADAVGEFLSKLNEFLCALFQKSNDSSKECQRHTGVVWDSGFQRCMGEMILIQSEIQPFLRKLASELGVKYE